MCKNMALLKIKCKKCLDTGCYWDEPLDNVVNCNCSKSVEDVEDDTDDDNLMEDWNDIDLIGLQEEED